MAFASTTLRDNRTFGSSVSGGFSAAGSLSLNPAGLASSSASTPFGMPRMPVNDAMNARDEKSIVVPTMLDALPNDPQLTYDKGTMLIGFRTEQGVTNQRYSALSLPVTNYMLELAARQRGVSARERGAYEAIELATSLNTAMTQAGTPQAAGQDHLKRRRLLGSESAAMNPAARLPVTLEECEEVFTWLGVFNSHSDKGNARERMSGLTVEGRATLPDLWPRAGMTDTVGLMYQEVDNAYNAFFSWDGTAVSAATRGRYIQVVPWWESQNSEAVVATNYDMPLQRRDASCYSGVVLPCDLFPEERDSGLLDLDAEASRLQPQHPFVLDRFTQCPVIKLGQIKRRAQVATDDEVKMALRSTKAWQALLYRCPLDIVLDTTTNAQLGLV